MDAPARVQLEARRRTGRGSGVPDPAPGASETAVPMTVSPAPAPKRERTNWASEDEFLFGLIRKLDCPVFLGPHQNRPGPQGPSPAADRHPHPASSASPRSSPFSARKRDGLDLLTRKIIDILPVGERYYPKDQYTDQPSAFHGRRADPREHPGREPAREVPYASGRDSSSALLKRPSPRLPRRKKGQAPALAMPLTRSRRPFTANANGQKAILIGKGGGQAPRRSATGARRQIESFLGTRVYLELHVIVEPNWRESRPSSESLDWRNQLERLADSQISPKHLSDDE